MQSKEYRLRRDKLLKQLGSNSIAIIPAAGEYIRSGTEYYPYRQNSDFYYLTGLIEPEALAVFIPGRKEGEFVLFSRERDSIKELWNGPRAGCEGACKKFGAHQAFVITEADNILPRLLAGRKSIYFNLGYDHIFDLKVNFWLDQVRSRANDKIDATPRLVNLGEILHEMRLKKTQSELALLCKAAEITAKGFLRAMRKCKPGVREFELEAELLYEFMRLGGRYESFKTIIGGGANACTLHYSRNTEELVAGELVLVDAGVEYEYYCADVTRTFPVNGKFTFEQCAIYEAVLDVQAEVINQIRPGIRFNALQMTAERVVTEHLVRLRLLKGRVDDLLVKQAFKSFFMHKIGHWLGLDAHDVGEYRVRDEWRVLEPGMVLTVEPGIYIISDRKVDDKWRNIGVRIEDEILVTKNGRDILTRMIPKTVTEIEKAMKNC